MTLQRGEIVLIRIGFHQGAGGKLRPALVLLDTGDQDFVAAPVTSRPRSSPHDLALSLWREAGLNVASTARIHKLTVLSKGDVVTRVGALQAADFENLAELLQLTFGRRS